MMASSTIYLKHDKRKAVVSLNDLVFLRMFKDAGFKACTPEEYWKTRLFSEVGFTSIEVTKTLQGEGSYPIGEVSHAKN